MNKTPAWTKIIDNYVNLAFAHNTRLVNVPDIPTNPDQFYLNMGLLEHPETRKPVPKLAFYQSNVWKDAFHYRYRMILKSQKVGITTTSLMEDFQRAILPSEHPMSCRGQEILIIAQSLEMAKQHLYTMRKLILNSNKYRDFMITKPNELLLRDEVTKVTTLFIKNPDNPNKPTRIIARGPHESGVWSWKEVKHIHMSDIASNPAVDDKGLFGAVFSRLANTGGSLLIETPPRGQRGTVWDIYKKSEMKDDEESELARFKIRRIPADFGVQAGLIKQEFLDAERVRLGPLYGQYYECDFVNPETTWYDKEMFKHNDNLATSLGM
jgi:hypothetical protein